MNSTKKIPGLGGFPFHTILLSVYPILFVYSQNIASVTFIDTIRFMVFSVGFFTFLLLCFQIVLKDWGKAGGLSSLLACLFFSFGHIANALEQLLYQRGFDLNLLVLAWIWLIIFLLLSFYIVRFSLPDKTTRSINLISGILIILSLAVIISVGDITSDLGQNDYEKLKQLRGQEQAEELLNSIPPSELPDIYYIIFDGYLRADILQKLFDYDSSSFTADLEQRGFYLVSSSHSNYLNTNYSLNTSLNLLYFHDFPKRIFNKTKYNLYTNYVNDFLKDQGYQTVVFDSGTGDTNDQDYDYFIASETVKSQEKGPINPFEQFFLRTTLGLLFFNSPDHDPSPAQTDDLIQSTVNQELSLRRERINYALDHIPDYAPEDGHYFLFSHIYLPHIPFLYGPEGEELKYHKNINLYWYEVEQDNYIKYYNYQIDYLNKKILDTIDTILANSKKPVVIVLQADHGDEKYLDRDAPTSQGINVRSAIFNAIYFSDQSYDELYPTMTPVNTFRVILNHWFGTQYPLLNDKVFFHEHPTSTGVKEKPEFTDTCPEFELCLPPPPY